MGQPDEERRRPALQPAASFAVRALLAGFVFVVTGRLANRRAEPRVSACNGFTQPYDGIKLNGEQLEQLDAGRKLTLSKREAGVGGGRGTAVCDIAAPPKEIWKTILDFDHYKGRLAQCKYSTVYERKKNVMSRTETIKVHMKLDGIIRDFNCYYDHTFKPDKNELTWTLDPEKENDFLDVQGQWIVEKHPSKPDHSRVFYSADVLLPSWLPGMVVVTLCKTSGIKALTFVKKAAEADFATKQTGGFVRPRASRLRAGLGGGGRGGASGRALGKARFGGAPALRPFGFKR